MRPATVTVPVRVCEDWFRATTYVIVAGPVPLAGSETVIHDVLLDALQAHP